MFLNENKKDRIIYILLNNQTTKSVIQLFNIIYTDHSCLEDLKNVGIIYKGMLYNMSEIPEHILGAIDIMIGGAAAHLRRNRLLCNTFDEFKCEGV